MVCPVGDVMSGKREYDLFEQSDDVIEWWYDKAYRSLVDSARLPFVDELPEDSASDELIREYAQELYEVRCWAEYAQRSQ